MLFSDFFNEIGGDSLKLLVNTIYSIMLSNLLLGIGLNFLDTRTITVHTAAHQGL
jgi:hypothetical protein